MIPWSPSTWGRIGNSTPRHKACVLRIMEAVTYIKPDDSFDPPVFHSRFPNKEAKRRFSFLQVEIRYVCSLPTHRRQWKHLPFPVVSRAKWFHEAVAFEMLKQLFQTNWMIRNQVMFPNRYTIEILEFEASHIVSLFD